MVTVTAALSAAAQPRQHEGYPLDGVIRFDETQLEDAHSPGPLCTYDGSGEVSGTGKFPF